MKFGVIGSIPDSGAWRNRHTRVPQEHVAVRPCGFESRRPDQIGEPMPTVTVDDGDEELMRCRGYPTAEAVDRIIELCE